MEINLFKQSFKLKHAIHEQQLFCTREYLLSYYIDHFIVSNRHKGRTMQISKIIAGEGIKGNTMEIVGQCLLEWIERDNVRDNCAQ